MFNPFQRRKMLDGSFFRKSHLFMYFEIVYLELNAYVPLPGICCLSSMISSNQRVLLCSV